jgi:hypothetical protein
MEGFLPAPLVLTPHTELLAHIRELEASALRRRRVGVLRPSQERGPPTHAAPLSVGAPRRMMHFIRSGRGGMVGLILALVCWFVGQCRGWRDGRWEGRIYRDEAAFTGEMCQCVNA